jgi:hypothetical protein
MNADEERYFEELPGQGVESLGHWNVSIGGYDVNGLNGPPDVHPIVRMGEAAVEPLLDRIRRSPNPLREILLLDAITGRQSTDLENYVVNFKEPPEEAVAVERLRVLDEYERDRGGG